MSENLQILLNSQKNVASVNVDTYQKFEVDNKVLPIFDYNIRNAMSATEIFDIEREYYDSYRIYGRIEYLSLLNGLSINYTSLSDFFLPKQTYNKDIYNSFDFYLMKVATGYTKITGTTVVIPTGTTTTTTTTTVNPRTIIIDDNFDNWVSGAPVGWTGVTDPTSSILQTVTNSVQFKVGTGMFPFASIQRDITLTSGRIVIETEISSTPVTELGLNMSLVDGVDINIISLSSGGTGYKKIIIDVPVDKPIFKISIYGGMMGLNDVSFFMDYFLMYVDNTATPDDNNNNDTVIDGDVPNATLGSYVRYFEVIATPDDLDLYNAGFSNNVYGNQVYAYNYNKDFDITPYVGMFNFPATELFLYAQYQKAYTNIGNETLSGVTWDATTGKPKKVAISSGFLNVGDIVYGDIIEYSMSQFLQLESIPQTYFISTPYKDNLDEKQRLQWKYNPFLPLRLRYFKDELSKANTGSTTYSEQISIPYYATNYPEGTGNYVWRDILPQGFIDPTTGLGVDYPFINKNRYLFSRLILDVTPNLNDVHTANVFTEIRFDNPIQLAITPNSDINNIGKPCQ